MFDQFTTDDLLFSFFPCIYFSANNSYIFDGTWMTYEQRGMTEREINENILQLIIKDKRSMQLFMDGCYQICFRNHQKNKKGKVTYAEAYFAEQKTRYEEIR